MISADLETARRHLLTEHCIETTTANTTEGREKLDNCLRSVGSIGLRDFFCYLCFGKKSCGFWITYRARNNGLYVVGRTLLVLLLTCFALPCLGPT